MPNMVKTMRPIGPPVSMAGSSTLRLAPFSSRSCTRLRTSRVFLPKRSNLTTMRTSRGEFRTQVAIVSERSVGALVFEITSPAAGRLHVAAGNPCKTEFVTYSL
jgi:hypothetical protein